ncbi:MAG: PA14 domain-containing protein [Methylococcales bacterium]|nr:PA14 domain-containing protein [Methylococcales bacterium]
MNIAKLPGHFLLAALLPLWLATFDAIACTAPAEHFCVDYFTNSNLSGTPALQADEAVIDHDWQSGSPGLAIPNNTFSGHWQGVFTFTGGSYIFHELADDGVRLKIDGQVVINGWQNQAPTHYYATVPLSEGTHTIEVDYYEGYGGARLKLDWQPVRTCGWPVGQFCVTYYDNQNLTGNPPLLAYEPTIAHSWGDGSPASTIPNNVFSGRWQGQFDFEPGTYVFNSLSDDGIRVWVDGQLLIDAWVNQASTAYNKQLWLSGRHQVKVEYYESWGGATLNVDWELLPPPPAPPISTTPTAALGSNLSDWMDWGTEQPFINLFKTSRAWITQAPGVWDTGETAKLDLDADGWVRSLPAATDATTVYRSVSTLLLNGFDLNGLRPSGEYVVLYDGAGRIEYSLAARKNTDTSSPGRDVINVDNNNSGGIQLTIAETDPQHTGNYLRNIRVVSSGKVCSDDLLAYCASDTDPACQRTACTSMEAVAGSRLYHPQFLRTLTPYQALRYMSPMSINVISSSEPQLVNWAQRARLETARWSNQMGIPLEAATTLANQTKTDPWLNMPHQASDDYMRQAAKLAHDTLDPARKVYLEYANEIWNGGFSAGNWVQNQGLAEWPTTPDSPYTKRINWYGKRSAQMCDLWRSEWPGEENRIICVIAAQAANPWTASAALDCQLWSEAPCQAHGIKAIAIAPYFGDYLGDPANEGQLTAWTADADGGLGKLFTELEFGGQLASGPIGGALALANQRITQYADLAVSRNLSLLAYEGGQHLVGVGNVVHNQNITNLFIAANRDPRMGDLYSKYLGNWRTAGGGLFINFTSMGQYGRYGSWGVLENSTQTHTPKFDALIRYKTSQ